METRKTFTEGLSRLRHDILEMATKVEENLGKALSALRNHDSVLAEEVRESDKDVDTLQQKIENDVAMIIATQQPVARDLREMVTIFKLTSNIERIGDHAVHLARAAIRLVKKNETRLNMHIASSVHHLEKMAQIGQIMIHDAISAFMEKDAAAARNTAAMDSDIDKEHKALTEDLLKLMKKNPDMVKTAYKILHASSQLERLGDHITNICEAVIYMTEGKHEELNE